MLLTTGSVLACRCEVPDHPKTAFAWDVDLIEVRMPISLALPGLPWNDPVVLQAEVVRTWRGNPHPFVTVFVETDGCAAKWRPGEHLVLGRGQFALPGRFHLHRCSPFVRGQAAVEEVFGAGKWRLELSTLSPHREGAETSFQLRNNDVFDENYRRFYSLPISP